MGKHERHKALSLIGRSTVTVTRVLCPLCKFHRWKPETLLERALQPLPSYIAWSHKAGGYAGITASTRIAWEDANPAILEIVSEIAKAMEPALHDLSQRLSKSYTKSSLMSQSSKTTTRKRRPTPASESIDGAQHL